MGSNPWHAGRGYFFFLAFFTALGALELGAAFLAGLDNFFFVVALPLNMAS